MTDTMTRPTGHPVKNHIKPRDFFGHGMVVQTGIRIDGVRAAILLCACSSEYSATVDSLIRGRRTACGHCKWSKGGPTRFAAKRQARQVALEAANKAIAELGYGVAGLTVRKRKAR